MLKSVSLNVAPGVQEQPFSDEETIEGTMNRARNDLTESDTQIGIGLEGGMVEIKHGLFLYNWGALAVR
ncbi:non-canonical (house-cleaning) NTP pyrophosphatase [Peribacillus huizhouensis]|uniref:inosine/xanthosine triphosphatase n=1 Tax=Peribacillus huizhouensis TaxID=1501239 RepID=A0ABR6CNK0_9BACI|nr:non-canonical (house-cleaning) NTP pyrophosphatase [Peribacillus huizhouensis]